MRNETTQMYRSNGLIDDLVIYAKPEAYALFTEMVGKVIHSKAPALIRSDSGISIEIICDERREVLFTPLQNKTNQNFSLEDWNRRNILRLWGIRNRLSELKGYLEEFAKRGLEYSYISEYSEAASYSQYSPEWWLHMELDKKNDGAAGSFSDVQ